LFNEVYCARVSRSTDMDLSTLIARAREADLDELRKESHFARRGLESYTTGHRLLIGDGAVADYEAAEKQLTRAVNEGNSQALFDLGCMRRDGLNGKVCNITAHQWFNLAVARSYGVGAEEARRARKEIELQLDADEITEAQRLAREWDEARPR